MKCPACSRKFLVEELASMEAIRCPGCGFVVELDNKPDAQVSKKKNKRTLKSSDKSSCLTGAFVGFVVSLILVKVIFHLELAGAGAGGDDMIRVIYIFILMPICIIFGAACALNKR